MSLTDKYIKRNNMYGENIREVKINNSRRMLSSTFKDSPNYYNVSYLSVESDYGEEISTDVQINDKSDIKDEKWITTPYETPLSSGDIFDWLNHKWIVTITDDMSEIYKRGILKRCVSNLKWIDNSGVIRGEWITFKVDIPSNFGIDESKLLVLPDERRQVLLRDNKYTRELVKYQRFILDGRAWKTIAVDRLSLNGLIILTIDEDVIVTTDDNLELEVANYNSRLSNYKIHVTNLIDELQIDTAYKLNVQLLKNDVEVNSLLTFSSSNVDVATIDNDGVITTLNEGFTEISISYLNIAITKFTIGVTSTPKQEVFLVCDFSPTIFVNESKSFNVHYEVSGNIYDDSSIFKITTHGDLSPTNTASIVSQSNNTCVIKALSKIGYFDLHISNSDNSINNIVKIQIKPLF